LAGTSSYRVNHASVAHARPLAQQMSCGHRQQIWRFGKLRFLEALSGRTVKQNCVSIGLPDCSEPDAPGTVQTEVDATRRTTPDQNPFRHLENADFQVLVVTKGFINKGP